MTKNLNETPKIIRLKLIEKLTRIRGQPRSIRLDENFTGRGWLPTYAKGVYFVSFFEFMH